jgi:hypothetical protein
MSPTPRTSTVPAARRATPRARSRRAMRRRWVLPVLGCAAAAALVAGAPPAAADTPWGDTGAFYAGGITCHLRGGTVVPMATWNVEGTATFATADISETGGSYGSAPTNGSAAPIQPGDGGLDQNAIGAAAYLLDHNSTGSTAQVADVSADIAALAGGGGVQSRCLGQQGTSTKKAAALLTRAQRYAGPYKVSLSLPPRAQPGKPVTVTARVTSAVGLPTPGIDVTFAVNGATVAAASGSDGVARTQVATPSTASAPITASLAEPVSLTYYATDPGAVALAAPVTVTALGSLTPVLHPTPRVVTQAPGLVLRDGTITPRATITGTYGYVGTGSISVLGPVHAAAGKDCSSLHSSSYAAAPTVWKGNFGFVGDGTHDAGRTPQLADGCYAVSATVTTTNSAPPARATSGLGETVVVSKLQLSESTGPGVVAAGGLAATVIGADAGGAKVRTSITVHGPISPVGGSCAGNLNWSQAPIESVSDAARLTSSGAAAAATSASASPSAPAPGSPAASPTSSTPPAGTPSAGQAAAAATAGAVGATITMPQVDRVGCYALSARSTVTQNGQTIVVEPAVGSSGSTVLLAKPTLTVADAAYDGQVGKPMTGTLTVVGSYNFAGTLRVGLTSAPRTDVGCRGATFPPVATTAPQTGAVVTSSTTGDGTVPFTTPPARKNLCYAVTAVLTLQANPAVRATAPAPSTSSVFLAGVVLHTPKLSGIPGSDGDALMQAAVAGGITLLVIFAVAFTVIVRAFVRRNPRTA